VKRFRGLALVVVFVFLMAACGRSGNSSSSSSSSGGSGATSSSSSSSDATTLAAGGFGDLEKVCADGDAKGATDKGVTDTQIHIGTVTDKGFTGRSGLNKEMVDAANAFAKWCNEKGGILGRDIVVDDLDAKLTDYNGVVTTACDTDLALVGGGAVFDDADNGGREACGLPNIPGYVVTPKARAAKLQVQPLPNPVYQFAGGAFDAVDRIAPGSLKAASVMTGDLQTTIIVKDATVEALGIKGGTVVDQSQYSAGGEDNWSPFVTTLKDAGVKSLFYVGEPMNLALFEKAMATEGFYPDVIMETPNHYDHILTDTAGAAIKNTYVSSAFVPFEKASENKATQDYLDLMKQYNPSGKVASLGAQATSALLLFAQSATACGSNLTRQCVVQEAQKVTSWTGGGMHGASNPGKNLPTTCYVILKASASGFEYDEKATAPNKGLYNCDDANLIQLKNDYGVPRS
jgi:ABC-type branched-subunit amino acid transport system substrate-binding protein